MPLSSKTEEPGEQKEMVGLSETKEDKSQQPQGSVWSIDYFDDTWDSLYHVVCINRWHIFRANAKDASPKWELVPSNTFHHGAVHQRLYRNMRADQIQKSDLPKNLPEPPDCIPNKELELLGKPFPAPEPVSAASFPLLSRKVVAEGKGGLTLYVILDEDQYESSFGDGEFHYLKKVFFDEAQAGRFLEDNKEEWIRLHLRKLDIRVRGAILECPSLKFELFDEYTLGEAFAAAEALLSGTRE